MKRTHSILIATGALLLGLDLVTAFIINSQAAALGVIGAVIWVQLASLIEERRAALTEETGGGE